MFIFNTIKGKGVKPFEGDPVWHARKVKGEEQELLKKSWAYHEKTIWRGYF